MYLWEARNLTGPDAENSDDDTIVMDLCTYDKPVLLSSVSAKGNVCDAELARLKELSR